MRGQVLRLRGLVQRYRTDRRLPPVVLALYRRTALLRVRDRFERSLAAIRPVLGDGAGDVARLGSRRLTTAGPLRMSTSDLGHEIATAVTSTLHAAGLTPFVVDRCGDGLQIGLTIDERQPAIDALAARLPGDGWFVEWADGPQSGVTALDRLSRSRHVRRARSWRVFRAHRFGDRTIGAEQAAEVTFWQLGTSRQLEQVGTRGHERFDPASAATVEKIDGREYPGRSAFPVGSNWEHVVDPIDIVYTWVDGSDPAWLESFRATAERSGRSLDDDALDPARYRSRDELRYSLRSVWTYCGWARRIWIVTAGQQPRWLADDDRVTIVDHRDILPADALPTFNSHAIEAALHHIDGLAEQFVYVNDDVFFGRPVRPELFFTPNGLARIFPSGARVPGAEHRDTLAVDRAALRGRELLARRFDRVVTDKPLHAPHPLLRTVLEDVEREFGDVVERTMHSRFRSPSDLSIAASFGLNYALATNRAVIGTITNEYVHVESGRLDRHLDRIRLGRDLDTFCINETEHTVGDTEARERRLADFFEAVQPIAAPWER